MISTLLFAALSLCSLLMGLHVRRAASSTYESPLLQRQAGSGWLLLSLVTALQAIEGALKAADPQRFRPGPGNPLAWADGAVVLGLLGYALWSWRKKGKAR